MGIAAPRLTVWLAALVVSLAFSATASAVPRVIESELDQSPAEVSRYWTPERMAAARPAEELVASDSGGRSTATHAEPDRIQVGDTTSFPNRVHGKVFFTIPSGINAGDYVCSGTAVGSPAGNVVVTAGHCVYDDAATGGNVAVTNFGFVPGYKQGARPFGTFSATSVFANQVWMNNGDLRFDVGAAVVADSPGGSLEAVVGARGIAFNQGRNQFFRSFGYPATSPFSGGLLYRCDSPYGGDDNSFPAPRPMVIACDMTSGSSGGGWVINGRFVNSLNSYKYTGGAGAEDDMYGPYFGDAALAVYEAAAGNLQCAGINPTHVGTAGDDVINGTPERDVIISFGGDDLIDGGGGDDIICAGDGDDTVVGGRGDDVLFGQGGSDTVDFSGSPTRVNVDLTKKRSGGDGVDVIDAFENVIGSARRDSLRGNELRNRLDGGRGRDQIEGLDGDDVLRGGRGADRADGGAGNDRIRGGQGDDDLRGNLGDDFLGGGPGDDVMRGGNGADRCRGGPGRDIERRCES